MKKKQKINDLLIWSINDYRQWEIISTIDLLNDDARSSFRSKKKYEIKLRWVVQIN